MRSYLYLNTNTSTSVSSNPDEAGYQWSNADIQMLLDEVYTRESVKHPIAPSRNSNGRIPHFITAWSNIYISQQFRLFSTDFYQISGDPI